MSRSTETGRPGSMRSSTSGSNTYVPALMRLLGSLPGGGFSTKREHPTGRVEVGDPERRRIGDGGEVDRGLGAGRAMGGDERTEVEIGEDVAVHHHERLVEAACSAAKRIAPAVSSGSGSTA